MSADSLYALAIEMLCSTNVYRRNIEEFHYPSQEDEEEVSLVHIVRYRSKNQARQRKRNTIEKQIAYKIVSASLAEYIENFPAVFSFKQRTKEKFAVWLQKIAEQYEIEGVEIPEILKIQPNENDTAIVMLKALHERKGVSKEELTRKLGINHLRSIQKNLRKLSPDLYEGPDIEKDNVYTPFRIGGQPVVADIRVCGVNNKNQKLYSTPNTIHPIVLQENLMQVGTLLQALCRNYCDYESEISMGIATDIWSQLSDYAKERIERIFGAEDRTFQKFIDQLNNVCPNQGFGMFLTERQMASDIEMMVGEALLYLEKADGRTGTVDYIGADGNRKRLEKQTIRRLCNCGSEEQFLLKSSDGSKQILNYNDIISIYIDP